MDNPLRTLKNIKVNVREVLVEKRELHNIKKMILGPYFVENKIHKLSSYECFSVLVLAYTVCNLLKSLRNPTYNICS